MPPHFMKVASSFFLGKQVHIGPVIASAENLYMIRRRGQINPNYVQGGAIGGAIAGLAAGKRPPSNPWTCDLSEVDKSVLEHADWPVSNNRGPVLIIPRSSVASMIHPPWTTLLAFLIDGERYAFSYYPFQGKRVRLFLEQTKWPLAWREKEPEEWRKLIR